MTVFWTFLNRIGVFKAMATSNRTFRSSPEIRCRAFVSSAACAQTGQCHGARSFLGACQDQWFFRAPMWSDVEGPKVIASTGCLKMLCTPINPMVLLIIIPIKWLFHWGYTLFSDTPWKSNSTDPLFSHLLSSALKVVYLQTRKTLDMLDPQSTKQRQSDARRCAPLLSRLQQQTGPHLNGRVTQFLQCNFQIVHVPFGMWW